MNKIITANINSFVFPIDEPAYDSLNIYLESIKLKVSESEVFSDIENRIAELFDHKLKNGSQAIFQSDIDEIIKQIGSAEQFSDESSEDDNQKEKDFEKTNRKANRRLYRNPDEKVLGGVCSGIAAYFNIDPVIVRLALGVSFFFFGTGFLLYIFLMLIIPKAQTPAEKLEMRGETVDYKNISKTLHNEFKQTYDHFKPELKNGFELFVSLFLKIAMIIGIIILVSMFIPGCMVVFSGIGIASLYLPVFSQYMFMTESQGLIILAGLILFLIIPLIAVAYKIIRIIFKTQRMKRFLKISLIAFWFIGFGLLSYSTFIIGSQFSSTGKTSETFSCTLDSSQKTFVVKLNDEPGHYTFDRNNNDYNLTSTEDLRSFLNEKISSNVHIIVQRTSARQPLVTIEKRSAGNNRSVAMNNAKSISYNYKYNDTTLSLNTYFTIKNNQLWRNQKI
ncbi:MAG: PspC domain-containing protein, partial [Bacteroidia bacterium]|nr:PspC domain-containing protein [Bacteroidia bacterium]